MPRLLQQPGYLGRVRLGAAGRSCCTLLWWWWVCELVAGLLLQSEVVTFSYLPVCQPLPRYWLLPFAA